ncbi:MAG: hypothetical protein ABSF70_00190 [Terracidiphilus sp.]|jgi:hypothetical protein
MKRRLLISIAALVASCGLVYAVGALEQAIKPKPELASWLPEGALLSIEARDFNSLLGDWNLSEEKRAWLVSDNHAAFSNSRLFTRLSQAQDEFSVAAGLPADESLLDKVAGKESCIALYDIGNLEFVYLTRLDESSFKSTPLWQTRGKFEERSEAGSNFYVRKDEQSSRVAAFASKDGWLILATREDLLAGVLDRMAGIVAQNLAGEGWYAEAVKQAASERGDLRMVLNLRKIVPSPYFRSYWVQRNVTEMKQYAAAVSDLYRTSQSYREERVLERRVASVAVPQIDMNNLVALVPDDAAFYAAQAAPETEKLLDELRTNLLEMKPQSAAAPSTNAPSAARAEDAGNATQFDMTIDNAPAAVKQLDAYEPLRALLVAAQPESSIEIYSSRPPRDSVFVSLQSAMALTSSRPWDVEAVRQALTQALFPGLTAGRLGVQWTKHSSAAGEFLELDGAVPLFVAVNGSQLLLSNDSTLLDEMLARRTTQGQAGEKNTMTYTALFRLRQEQGNFRRLMKQLDLAGHGSAASQDGSGNSAAPAFFSGNVANLGRAFANMDSERIVENDRGTMVTQTVTYQWTH